MNSLAPIVSSDTEQLILVNEQDEEIGSLSKRDCHVDSGILHRAFSIFIFNHAGEVLLQKRSEEKFLWPLYWSNACCSHPRAGEDSEEAAHRRLEQELGIKTDLTYLYKFVYQADFNSVGSEHELCWVWSGTAEAEDVNENTNEVAEWQFFSPEQLLADLAKTPDRFTPWMKMEWDKIRSDHGHQIP